MAELLNTVTFVWAGATTGSSIIGAPAIPGISRGTIVPPVTVFATGSIELEIASVSGTFVPVGETIFPGTASLIDPWPIGREYRLTSTTGSLGEDALNFDLIGQADGLQPAPSAATGSSPGGIPIRTFDDTINTRRQGLKDLT